MNNRSSAFTLIELLVVVSIMLLLLGGGLVGYIRFNDRQMVLQSAKQVQQALRSAQTKARVGKKPAGCSFLQGYRVTRSTDGTMLRTAALCGDKSIPATLVKVPSNEADQITTKLPAGVTVTPSVDMVFWTLFGGVTPKWGTSDSSIAIVVQNSATCYTFSVTKGGDITEGEWGCLLPP